MNIGKAVGAAVHDTFNTIGHAAKDVVNGVEGVGKGLEKTAAGVLHGNAKEAASGLFQAGKAAYKTYDGAKTLTPEGLAEKELMHGAIAAVDKMKSQKNEIA
jgi:hypothetical protein